MNDYKNFLDRHSKYLRYLLVLSLITFGIFLVAETVDAAWYNTNWQYRKKITIQSSQVSGGPHSNFPVLISRTDIDLRDDARDDGYDILFTSSDEVSKIPHEIEKFNGGTGELLAWVKVGSVSSASNTDIYMYYGYASATDQQDAANVWDSSYRGVWHLKESGNGTVDEFLDSSGPNHGRGGGGNSSYTPSQDTGGKIGNAQLFDGSNDYIRVEDDASLHISNYLTVEAWIYPNADYVWQTIVSKMLNQTEHLYFVLDDSTTSIYLGLNGVRNDWDTGRNVATGGWHYVAFTYDGTIIRVYRDDMQVTSSTNSGTLTLGSNTQPLYIGFNEGWTNEVWHGKMDEVRISSVARSPGWIATSYSNQNDPANFVSFDIETSGGGGGNNPPTVDAGSNQNITLPASANLDGEATDGGDGPTDPPNVEWTKTSGPGTVTFGDEYAQDTTASFSTNGVYVLRLTADDGADTAYDEVTITVNPVGGPPQLGDYSCNMKITINSAQVAGDLDNFPVLISLTDESLKTSGCGFMTDPDGDDIVFTDSSKTIELDHEIEKYDETTGELVAWVEVPFLSGSSNTDIYMYFGNSNVTSPQNNPTGVWDSNYKGVWHLKEDAITASPTTLEVSVGTQDDDAEEAAGGGMDLSSSDLELVEESSVQQVGMRFTNMTIPPGATITDAYVEFTVDEEAPTVTTNLTLWGELDDNPGTFTSTAGDISNRDKTSASVAWNITEQWTPVGAKKQSPDIKSIIQEIVDQPLWASGNAMVIIVTGTGKRVADSYSGTAPLLHVEYTTPASVHLDSTSNDNDGIPNGNTYTASGKIDGAQDFDGINDYVELPDLITSDTGTISLWVKPSSMLSHTIFDASSGSKYFYIDINGSSLLRANLEDSADADFNTSEDVSSLSPNQWYYLTFAWRFGSSPVIRLYRDGNLVDQNTGTSGSIADFLTIYLGRSRSYYHTSFELDGNLDEVRLSDSIRSDAWIQTSYNNQNSPSSFYSVEKDCPGDAPPIAEFTCSLPITIDSSKVSGTSDLIDFPVLISLTDSGLKTTANCGYVEDSDGYDIIFSDATQTTILDHEIEKYDGSSGELIAWVRVPTLSATADTTIYLHFGYSVGGGACGDTENPSGVWDSNYKGVWHLADMNNIADSTSHNNDGTSTNVDDATGKIGTGQDFDGNDSIQVPNSSSLDITGDQITLSAWVKSTANQDDDAGIVIKNNLGGVYNYNLNVQTSDQGNFRVTTPTGETYLTAGPTLNVGQWYFLYGIYNGSTAKLYLDGSEVGTANRTGNILSTTEPVLIGRRALDDARYFTGVIDEVHISDVARSTDWMKTEYNNQSDPSSFYSVGASSCFLLSGFSCNRKITIDSSQVDSTSDLINFPVLIKIDNDCNIKTAANGGSVQDSSGWDIVFTDSDGLTQLAHEIEEYDGDSGDLTAWVKIPTLPYNSDKDIYMYYGKSGLACDPSNPTGVWSNSYRGVWHLNDTSGATQDSTSYNTDGTLSGTVTREANGEIDNAFDVGNQGEVNWGDPGDGHLDAGTGSWTVSLWTNIASNRGSGMWEKIINKGKNSNQAGYEMELDDTANNLYFAINDGSYSEWGRSAVLSSFSLNTWMYLVGVVDRSSNRIRLYKDGNEVDYTYLDTIGNLDVGDSLTIGKSTWGYPYARFEEVRVSSVARSAGWIMTEYNNQNDPSSFYSMSQDTCGGSYGFNYQYCKKITVDRTQVIQASNPNFPLLINLQNYDDLKTVENGGRVGNDNGWDIVFKDKNCLTLDHEIDYYDGTTGTLVAWVRIPDLTNTEDYEVYMYYGDSNVICSPENPDGLWDPSIYEAVYHLSDDYKDSTSNDRDGTNNGTTFTASQIGRGALFTPSNGWDHIDLGSWSVSDNDLVIQAWVWPNDFNQNDPRIVSKCADWGSSAQQHVFMLSLYNGDNGENRMRFRVKTGTDNAAGTVELFGNSPTGYLPSAQEWYFLTASYIDSSDQMKLWRDSTGDATVWQDGWLRQNSWPVWIGASPYNSSNSSYTWDGIVDEVRIISQPRSAGWITTEYRNQSDPGNFYTVGSCFEQTNEVTQEWVEEVQ